MSIGVADRKLLWGRSHNQCAYPGCPQALTVDIASTLPSSEDEPAAVIGEEAHIRSGRATGPRHDPSYPADGIDSYANLILLCPTHHTIIDKDGGRGFSIRDLEVMRADHETAMHSLESRREEIDRISAEMTARALATWEETLAVAHWQRLTWSLNRPVPYLSKGRWQPLFDTATWLLAVDWPRRYPTLQHAIERFSAVLGLLVEHMTTTFEHDDTGYQMRREYKNIPWDPDLYEELINEFRVDAATLWILTAELTRAANLVIAAARTDLDPMYRFDAGVLLMADGDAIIEPVYVTRLEYPSQDPSALPHLPTLQQLKDAVAARAQHLGITADRISAYTFVVTAPEAKAAEETT